MKLRNQKCKVYEQNIIPQEPVKEVNDIYKLRKFYGNSQCVIQLFASLIYFFNYSSRGKFQLH